MKTYPLTHKKDAAGKHRSQIKADNGNITYASTEGYENKADCENADRVNMYSLMAHFGVEAKESSDGSK